MQRVYNYSAGPSVLPIEVLDQIKNELYDFNNSKMSVMEISHRSKQCIDLFDQTEQLLRKLMNIPNSYSVLFMQGGARQQFAMAPMNLFAENKKADFIHTGSWTKYAIKEAKKFGEVCILASGEKDSFKKLPNLKDIANSADSDFIYLCTNNTIEGTKFSCSDIPEYTIPLIADMSSNILSEKYDTDKFSLIFAGAQKNLGIAGVTVVIIKNDLLERSSDYLPEMLNYKVMIEKKSMLNTPPVFAVYVLNKVLKWLDKLGGVSEMEKANKYKAALLYEYIDNSKIFSNDVDISSRSAMNVIFTLPSEDENKIFDKYAQEKGFMFLKGHRSVGGMRASIYNAASLEQVEALIDLMKEYELNR
jgi:phosphoserine aminotransferase